MHNEVSEAAAGRRRFLAVCAAMGLGQTLFPGVLLGIMAQAGGGASSPGGLAGPSYGARMAGHEALKTHETRVPITAEMIETAAAVAGLTFTEAERQMMLDGVQEKRESVFVLRSLQMENAVSPAVVFDPMPSGTVLPKTAAGPMRMSAAPDVRGMAA